MADPVTTHIAEHYQIYGLVIFGGGVGNMVRVHSKNITALWAQKQDINVCNTEHKHVTATLNEIKDDVKEILRIKRNGG